jgi:excisionase family DNA binding protein
MEDLDRMLDELRKIMLSHKQVLNLVEASKYSGLSIRTLRQLIREGKLPYSKPNKKNIYLKTIDVNKFLTK